MEKSHTQVPGQWAGPMPLLLLSLRLLNSLAFGAGSHGEETLTLTQFKAV